MAVSLTQIERSAPPGGDGRAAVAALQQRVARLNLAQAVHGQRLIVLLEGWAGSGKKSVLRLLAGALDPCCTAVHCGGQPELGDDGRHWLAPYWSRLPRSGHSAVFYHGWYRQVVERRLAGDLDRKDWARLTDEINEFEAQQTDHGTLLVKLFFHVADDVQARRIAERRRDPWLGALEQPAEPAGPQRTEAIAAWDSTFAVTDTRWAPWRLIDGNESIPAQIAALTAIADALQTAVPAEPPRMESAPAIPLGQESVFA